MPLVPKDGGHDENAASLINAAELLFEVLDAVSARTVVEVGAFHGTSTKQLLEWAAGTGARITAIDPLPEASLDRLAAEHPELTLIRKTSHQTLPGLAGSDVIILDGDHNYYTLAEELSQIASAGERLPLLVFHDVGWPLARRDAYYAPERIPPEHRQELARNVSVAPGEPGLVDGGLPFACIAVREGGPRNGIMTAIEDFIGDRDDLQLAVVPAFFGIGFLWDRGARWAEAVAVALQPWDRNPVIARLEANRIVHMVERWRLAYGVADAMPRWKRAAEQEALLRTMLDSGAFAAAEKLSQIRQRGTPAFSREQIRRALG